DHVIGRAAATLVALGLMLDSEAGVGLLGGLAQQTFKRAPVGVLGLLIDRRGGQRFEVGVEVGRHESLPRPTIPRFARRWQPPRALPLLPHLTLAGPLPGRGLRQKTRRITLAPRRGRRLTGMTYAPTPPAPFDPAAPRPLALQRPRIAPETWRQARA